MVSLEIKTKLAGLTTIALAGTAAYINFDKEQG